MLSILDRAARMAWRAARALAEMRRNAVALRDLRNLDERGLRDIGLSHRAAAGLPGTTVSGVDRRACR